MAAEIVVGPSLASIAVAFLMMLRFGAPLARITRLPSITLFLAVGAAGRASGLFSASASELLTPLHQAALAVITFAAGSELELESLIANYRLVRSLAMCLTLVALAVVFVLGALVMTIVPPGGDESTIGQIVAASFLASVIAIARSPSSAIGVVSELNADGPFTQCVLSVTMVTDVVVVVLFTAAVEVVEAALTPTHAAHAAHGDMQHPQPIELDAPDDHSPLAVAVRFSSRTALHLGLSLGLGAVLALSCAVLLKLPPLPFQASKRLLRPLGVTLVGALAFEAEKVRPPQAPSSHTAHTLALSPGWHRRSDAQPEPLAQARPSPSIAARAPSPRLNKGRAPSPCALAR